MKKSMLLFLSIISFSSYAAAPLAPEQAVLGLSEAVQDGDVDKARTLLQENDIDINATVRGGWSFLMDAAYHGHADIIELLLGVEGIEVNYTKQDRGALHYAVLYKHSEAVARLASYEKIELDVSTEEGETPLMVAAFSGQKEIVRILLQAGADKSRRNKCGKNAYEMALCGAYEMKSLGLEKNKKAIKFQEIADYIRDYESSGQLTKSAHKQ